MENTFTSLSKYIPSKVLAQEYFSHLFLHSDLGRSCKAERLNNNCCVSQRGRKEGRQAGIGVLKLHPTLEL